MCGRLCEAKKCSRFVDLSFMSGGRCSGTIRPRQAAAPGREGVKSTCSCVDFKSVARALPRFVLRPFCTHTQPLCSFDSVCRH